MNSSASGPRQSKRRIANPSGGFQGLCHQFLLRRSVRRVHGRSHTDGGTGAPANAGNLETAHVLGLKNWISTHVMIPFFQCSRQLRGHAFRKQTEHGLPTMDLTEICWASSSLTPVKKSEPFVGSIMFSGKPRAKTKGRRTTGLNPPRVSFQTSQN